VHRQREPTVAAKRGAALISPNRSLANKPKKAIPGMTVHAVERVDEALQLVRNLP
jgi:hypothetical protein